jgi:hypothetical protein
MRKSFTISLMLLSVIVLGITLSSCEEESTDCEAVVTVKYLGDTAMVVPDAQVILGKDFAVRVDGVTDQNGEFRHTFELEAILDITASKDTGMYLEGNSVIRLRPGKTVYRTVYIGPPAP